MKDSSKIAYMLFKDKISLALTNNWIDEDGMIYLIFQQKDLMEMLNCYQGKVKSTLDELEKYGLLEVLRGGFDAKAGKHSKQILSLTARVRKRRFILINKYN